MNKTIHAFLNLEIFYFFIKHLIKVKLFAWTLKAEIGDRSLHWVHFSFDVFSLLKLCFSSLPIYKKLDKRFRFVSLYSILIDIQITGQWKFANLNESNFVKILNRFGNLLFSYQASLWSEITCMDTKSKDCCRAFTEYTECWDNYIIYVPFTSTSSRSCFVSLSAC